MMATHFGRWCSKPWWLAAALAGCASTSQVQLMEPGRHLDHVGFRECAPADVDTLPTLIRGNAPYLPVFDAGFPGPREVNVAFDIDDAGRTARIDVQTEAGKFAEAHTSSAISQWLFNPATRSGKPVGVRCTMRFSYQVRAEDNPLLGARPRRW